jgi:hypothetical protein
MTSQTEMGILWKGMYAHPEEAEGETGNVIFEFGKAGA